MSAQEVLQELYDSRGMLTPALVVEVAADPDHELHDRFEWDESEAARRYRLVQAGDLIRSVTVRVDRGQDRPPVRVRAFVADHDIAAPVVEDAEGQVLAGSYRPVSEVVESDVLRTAWFRSLARDWQRLRKRAGDSEEFAAMVLGDLRGDVG